MTGDVYSGSSKMVGNNYSAVMRTGHFPSILKQPDVRNIKPGEKETLKGKV